MKRVAENLYRGPRPHSYEKLKQDVPGVSVIVDLQSGIENWFGETPYETDSARENKIRRDSHHLSDWGRPCSKRLVTIAKDIAAYLAAGEVVYIHCRHGVDRTGLVIATWRMLSRNWFLEEAREELYKMGFHKFPYFYWVKSLREVDQIIRGQKK